jgi:pyruvate/2-oxoglutarate dehydrogenase complex dihydrolipoamide dehydrogenase (E3) component
MNDFEYQPISPLDAYNQQLIAAVHPPNWVNPLPVDRYDLVVIGAGTAGLVVAAGAAGLGLGLKIALVERNLMGGDCLNFGCIPSKTIIRSARLIGEILRGQELGITAGQIEIDFATVMARLRRIRSHISEHDSAARFQGLGIDVFLGNGQFTGQDTVQVGAQLLRFKKAVIATGARAAIPPIPGLSAAGYLTNETVFSLVQRPSRLAVIGAGPVGCELAQTFQRLGCAVTLLQRSPQILPKEDPAAADLLQGVLTAEGVQLVLDCEIQQVTTTREGKAIAYLSQGQSQTMTVDEILVSAGRTPNIESLNLAAVGVTSDRAGVCVNDYLQTTNPKIYGAGDVCMAWQFTHAADAAARIVIKNMLFAPFGWGKSKLSQLVMPWVTYTDPEIAQVGLSEAAAREQGIAFQTIEISMAAVDRATTDGETNGFLKIRYQSGTDRILGATLVASHAGDMISEITLAIANNIGLSKLSSVIHPYPTQAEIIKKAADAYRRTLLTGRTQEILKIISKFS